MLQRNAAQAGAPIPNLNPNPNPSPSPTPNQAGAPADAVQLVTVGGVWGIHCGCLLPMAEAYSTAVRSAHALMVNHVATLLRS